MLDGTQVLQRVALLLQGVLGGAVTLQHQHLCLQLHGLLGIGRSNHFALHSDGAANVQAGSLCVKLILSVKNHLQVLDHRAIVQFYKGASLYVAGGTNPTLQLDLLAQIGFVLMQHFSYGYNRHGISLFISKLYSASAFCRALEI